MARPVFSTKFKQEIVPTLNQIRFLEFIEAKAQQYGKHQPCTIEERCQKCSNYSQQMLTEELISNVRTSLTEIKTEIIDDDKSFVEACKREKELKMVKEKNNK